MPSFEERVALAEAPLQPGEGSFEARVAQAEEPLPRQPFALEQPQLDPNATADFTVPPGVQDSPLGQASTSPTPDELFVQQMHAQAQQPEVQEQLKQDVLGRIGDATSELRARSAEGFEDLSPEEQLAAINKQLEANGSPPLESLPEPKDFFDVVGEGLGVQTIPFVRSVKEGLELLDILGAAKRLEKGEGSTEDLTIIAEYQEALVEKARGTTFMGGAADILAQSAPFMGEFLVSGLFVGGAKAAGKAAVKKGVAAALGRALKTTGGLAVEAAKRSPFFAGTFATSTLKELVPQFDAPKGDDGALTFMVAAPGKPLAAAAINAAIDTYVEVFSESTGRAIAVIGRPLRALGDKLGIKPIRIGVGKFLGKIGYHGPIEEMGEERIGELLRAGINLVGNATLDKDSPFLDMPQDIPSLRQLGQELLAFSVPGVAAKAGSVTLDRLLTREGAQEFTEQQPEAAAGIVEASEAKKGKRTTRSAINKVLPKGEKASKAEQKQIVENLKAAVEAPAELGGTTRVEFPEPRIEAAVEEPVEAEPKEPTGPLNFKQFVESKGLTMADVKKGTKKLKQMRTAFAAHKARADFTDTLDEIGKEIEGKTFVSPLDPKLAKLFVKAAAQFVKAGGLTFAEFVNTMANKFTSAFVRQHGDGIKAAWNEERETNDKMDEAGDIEPILSERVGRTDLANAGDTPAQRELQTDVQEARLAEDEPGVVTQEEVDKEVARRLSTVAGYKKAKADLLEGRVLETQAGGANTATARTVTNRETDKMFETFDLDDILGAVKAAHAYQELGSDQGREFRQRIDRQMKPAERRKVGIKEALLTPPEKIKKKIKKAKESGDTKEVDRLQEQWSEEVAQIRFKLLALGIDLDQLDKIVQREIDALNAINQIGALKSSFFDKTVELWKNFILSSPSTDAANISGNILNSAWRIIGLRISDAIVNVGVRDKKGATFGEFKYMLPGVIKGIGKSFGNMLRTFQTEQPTLEQDIGRDTRARKFADSRNNTAIFGKKGRALRFFGTTKLLIEDEFFKTIIIHTVVGAHAYRIATREGKSEDALTIRIDELIDDVKSEAWDEAYAETLEAVFQQEPGPTAEAFIGVRKKLPPTQFLLPFIVTPANIFRTGIRMTPLGSFKLMKQVVQRAMTGKSADSISKLTAEQIVGWSVFLAILFKNDPDDPIITGSIEGTNPSDRQFSLRTRPSQSLRVPGVNDKEGKPIWWYYGRIEPFATAVGLIVDATNGLHKADRGDKFQLIGLPFASGIGQMSNKTFLQGISDFFRIFSATDKMREVGRWSSKFATSWIPNLIKHGSRSLDQTFPSRRIFGNKDEWLEKLWKRTVQKTELNIIADNPIVDVWGREAVRTQMHGKPKTDFLFRMFTPFTKRSENIADGDRVIMNWNLQQPAERVSTPVTPDPVYSRGGKNHFMTDDQYEQFLRLAGATANNLVSRLNLELEKPTDADLALVATSLRDARSAAKKALVKEWLEGDKAPTVDGLTETLARKLRRSLGKAARKRRTRGQSVEEAQRKRGLARRQRTRLP